MRLHLLACALLGAAGPASAVDGLLDSSFGIFSTGRNVVAIDNGGSNADTLADTLVGADGSIFLVGTSAGNASTTRFSITRLGANGIKDESFGDGGTVLSSVASLVATRAKFDAAGNIVVAGSRGIGATDRDFYLCRYNQQGEPAQFSAFANHCVTIAFDIPGGNLVDVANDVIIEPNGKIVLAGVAGFSETRDYAAVARLLPDGSLDESFSSDGRIIHAPTANQVNRFNAIARQADGKYIAVGESGFRDFPDGTDALFARLTTNGSLDPTYNGGDGYRLYAQNIGDAFNRRETATAVTILDNGKILMAGNGQTGATADKLFAFVYRINPSNVANVDPTFGNTGVARIGAGFAYELGDLLVQSSDDIVLIGTNSPSAGAARDLHVVRLKGDGSLDTDGFGANGRTNIDFILPGERDFGVAGALQAGRIIVAGHALRTAPQNLDLVVAGLASDLIFADTFD